MNVIVGGIVQESNTFSAAVSVLDDFKRYYYAAGENIAPPIEAHNELRGFYQAAGEHGVTLIPTIFACAISSGRLAREAMDELKRTVLESIERAPTCDGVLFALHGAWSAADNDDADGEMIEAIREQVGPHVPIVITLDSHANVTRKMVHHVNALVGYRTFPHTDFVETGYRAATLLFSIVRGEIRPHIRMHKLPMIVPVENQQTAHGPMAELWEEAASGERAGHSIVTSLFAVQPWLDVEQLGASVVVVGEDPAVSAAEAERLAQLMWEKRNRFDVELYTIEQVMDRLAEERPAEPVIVSDSADSVGAGSPGDSNFVLARLLASGAEQRFVCLLCMADAPAARQAAAAGVGSNVKLHVGYSVSTDIGSPIVIVGTVAYVGDGKFYYGGGTVANLQGNMGCCAVVRIGTLSLLLMENPVHTGDPAMYRSVGLEPLEADLVLVKSANQFRAEYEKLSSRIYIADTPGASTANLKSLPFRRISRPMYPFDDNFV